MALLSVVALCSPCQVLHGVHRGPWDVVAVMIGQKLKDPDVMVRDKAAKEL